MDTYIPPYIRLISPIFKRFTTKRRFTSDELPTLIEQSQDLIITYIYHHSLGDCGSSKLYLSVCLSHFYDLYFGYYRSDFDETVWKCWNLVRLILLKFHENQFIDVIMTSFLIFWLFSKGREFCGKGLSNYY